MPSIRTIALFGVLATLATDARPVEELKKRVECARHMAVDEQAAVAGAGRQGAWGRYGWGSFGSYGKDDDGSPSDKQEAEPSWPLNDGSSITSLQNGALGTLLGPSGSENEAPLETLPTIVDDLGEASTTLSAVQETSTSSPLVQEEASTFTAAQEPSETESLSGIQLIPIYADESSVATPVETGASASVPVNMTFRPGGGRGGHRPSAVPSANAETAPAPVAPVPEPASTIWGNPGSGPIVDPSDLPTTQQALAPTAAAPVPASNVPAPAAPTASVAAPPASPAPATGSSSSGKAGLAVNGESGSSWDSWTGGTVSWLYNWASAPPAGLPSSIEYVPQLWGSDADKVTKFNADLANFDAWGVTHLLSFNEPDIGRGDGGSATDAATGAAVHKQVFTADVASKYKVGSPAVARDGKQWLSDWEAACAGGCAYDFVPIHFYGRDASVFAGYLQEMSAFGKPLWVTEVACMEFSNGGKYVCTEAETTAFMKQVKSDMENPANNVERYSWFGAFLSTASSGNANGIMNADGTPNALGNLYLDKA